MYKKLVQNNKGSVTIMSTLLMLFAMLMMVTMSSNIVSMGIRMSKEQLDSAKAYYAAEAGAEKIIWEARRAGGIIDNSIIENDDCSICFDNISPTALVSDCVDIANPCSGTEVKNQIFSNGTNFIFQYNFGDTSGAGDDPPDGDVKISIEGSLGEVRRTIDLVW